MRPGDTIGLQASRALKGFVMASKLQRGFTVIELLVVVSIIALLIGILLPAIGKARDNAKVTQSKANLRQLGEAAAMYAADWNDRQFTVVTDNLAQYGSNIVSALTNFNSQHAGGGPNGAHPPVISGFSSGGRS